MNTEISRGELVPIRRALPVERPRFSQERQQPYIDAEFKVIEGKRLSDLRREIGMIEYNLIPLVPVVEEQPKPKTLGGAITELIFIFLGFIGNAAGESLKPLTHEK